MERLCPLRMDSARTPRARGYGRDLALARTSAFARRSRDSQDRYTQEPLGAAELSMSVPISTMAAPSRAGHGSAAPKSERAVADREVFDMRQDLVQHDCLALSSSGCRASNRREAPGTVEDDDGLIVQKGLDHVPQSETGGSRSAIVEPFFSEAHPTELLALSCDQAQVADLAERGPHQTRPRQRGQQGIGDVGLAPGYVLVTGIDHPRRNTHARVRT
jgi:hypothetical protein